MRILIIPQMFPPEVGAGASRVADFAKEWTKLGHKVTVLTGFPNYPKGKRFPKVNYGNRIYQRLIESEIEIIRTYNWFSKPGSFMGRMLNSLSSLISNSLYGLISRRRFDVVLATSPQPFILIQGWVIARAKGIPFIAEIRDPWPEVVSIEGLFAKSIPHTLLKKYITKMYLVCDMLVGVAESYKILFNREYGVPLRKIVIIRNGCNEEFFSPGPKENDFRKKNNLAGKFICSFVGNVGNFLRCETLVQAAHLLKEDPEIVFIFVGAGEGLKAVKQVKEDLKANNVVIFDPIPREQISFVFRASDISIAHAMNHPYYRTCIGAKIWEIMGSGVPILVGFEGETKSIVEEAGAGYAFEPENAEELAGLIKKIKTNPELAKRLGQNGREYILKGCTRSYLARKYLNEMRSILNLDREL